MDLYPTFSVRRAPLDAIVGLRHRILRAGLPRHVAIFSGEEQPDKLHFAAYMRGIVIGCASLHPSVFENRPAFQLRGMAVEPAYQGIGVGRELIVAVEEQTRQLGISVIWANCRTPAVPFYEKMGWKIISDEFDIETAGPHFKMVHWL